MHVLSNRYIRSFSGAVAVVLGNAATSPAQETEARLDVGAGRATDARGITSQALTVAPSVFVRQGASTVQLGASATRFGNDAWSLAGLAGWNGRAALTPWAAVSLDASGSYTGTSYDFTYAAAQALPAVELRSGGAFVFGGALAALGSSAQQQQRGGGLPFAGGTETVRNTRRAVGPVLGAGYALERGSAAVQFTARAERLAVDGVAVTDRVAAVTLREGIVTLAASGGLRRAPDERSGFASASLSLALSPTLALEASGGTYPMNRLTGTPAGRFVSAGLSFRTPGIGGGGREVRLPAAEGVRPPVRGVTRLSIRAPGAERVELAGDFNGWTVQPAHRAPNGVWYVDLRLAPGQYRYAFKVNGREWRVPDGVAAVDDDFGTPTAWLTVREPAMQSN